MSKGQWLNLGASYEFGQWQCLGASYEFIKNWDANYERNLEESVICIIFYAVVPPSSQTSIITNFYRDTNDQGPGFN